MGRIFSFLRKMKWSTEAKGTQWRCPICYDSREDISKVMPCGHQFCLSCSLRWTARTPKCPLCRRVVDTVRMSTQGPGYHMQMTVTNDRESQRDRIRARSAPGHPAENVPHPPRASSRGHLRASRPEVVGGLLYHVWAELFQRHEHLLDPVLPWMRQHLQLILGPHWWMVNCVEGIMLYLLCVCGLDEQAVVQMLQSGLEENTEELVRDLINVIVQQCSEEAQRLLRSRAAREDNSPEGSSSSSSLSPSRRQTAAPHLSYSTSSTDSDQEEAASITEAALAGGPNCPQSASIPTEFEQLQEEPVDTEEVAGSSAQGLGYRHSDPGRLSSHSFEGPQCLFERSCSVPLISEPSPAELEQPQEQGSSSRAESVPSPAEPEQPQEEPVDTEAVAGPSAQGCSSRHSTSSQDRCCSPTGTQRPRKRRASKSQDSPQPPKKLPRR